MRLQRLTPATDEAIYRQLWEWNQQTPDWFRASDDAWGIDSWEEFYERSQRADLIDCAVYDDAEELQGSITVIQSADSPGVWEVFLIGRRGGSASVLTTAAFMMAKELMDRGLAHAFVSWVAERNRGARQLNLAAGMRETGIVLYKGSYKGRPLKFLNYGMDTSRVNEMWEAICDEEQE